MPATLRTEEWMTAAAFAQRHGFSIKHVNFLCNSGSLPFKIRGNLILVNAASYSPETLTIPPEFNPVALLGL